MNLVILVLSLCLVSVEPRTYDAAYYSPFFTSLDEKITNGQAERVSGLFGDVEFERKYELAGSNSMINFTSGWGVTADTFRRLL